MKRPWVYMPSPSRSPLPPPSPPAPSRSSQSTRSEHLSHASNLGWWSVSPLIVYMFWCCSLETSHPRLLPQSLNDCYDNSICLASFAIYKTSYPRFMTSSHNFYDVTPTVFDMVSSVSVSSHPLYWWYHTNSVFEISSAIYDDIISILYDIAATECVSSHQHFQRYNMLCM